MLNVRIPNVVVGLLLMAGPLSAQQRPTRPALVTHARRPAAIGDANRSGWWPMRLSPADFSNPLRACRALRPAPRGEFETSIAFARRAAGLVPDAMLAFPIPTDTIAYDADIGGFDIAFDSENANGLSVTALKRSRYLTSLDMTNAFGAIINVRGYVDTVVEVTSARRGWYVDTEHLYLKVAPDSARRLKPALALALVFHPSIGRDSAAARQDDWTDRPTLDNPEAHLLTVCTISADEMSIWVYHRRTGEIVGRFDVLVPNP